MFRRLNPRFTELFTTEQGHRFLGELGAPNSYPRPRKEIQNVPHRALVTNRDSVAEAGSLVRAHGQEYLLAGQHLQAKVMRFLAVEVTDRVSWSRPSVITDPVTGMPTGDGVTVLDPSLPVCLEPGREFQEENFTEDMYRFFTHADVKPDDLINEHKVLRVQMLFGLRMVSVA